MPSLSLMNHLNGQAPRSTRMKATMNLRWRRLRQDPGCHIARSAFKKVDDWFAKLATKTTGKLTKGNVDIKIDFAKEAREMAVIKADARDAVRTAAIPRTPKSPTKSPDPGARGKTGGGGAPTKRTGCLHSFVRPRALSWLTAAPARSER